MVAETKVYDEFGNVISKTDASGKKTTYTYDPTYNMLIEEVVYTSDTEGLKTTYTLDETKRKVVSAHTAYSSRVQTGTTVYPWSRMDVPGAPGEYIWTSEEPISNV